MFTRENIDKLDEICLKYYLNRDRSHGVDHIQKVLKNVDKISKHFIFSSRENVILRACALLHDAYDHKYFQKPEDIRNIKEKISDDLTKFGLSWNEIQIIFIIIDNVSFSKEKAQRDRYYDLVALLSPNIVNIRNIVSDSDKIEALGIEGIQRMILYSVHKISDKITTSIIDDIKQLCENKLYILISGNYIRTDIGRKIASQKLEELKKITENDDTLQKFVTDFLN
jgi:HD superfamily phosphodiesterase